MSANNAPPAYSQPGNDNGGYFALPQQDYGPPTNGYQTATAPPPVGYGTVPAYQQQSNNTNVVVIGQPTAPSEVHVQAVPRANDYMVFTAIMMILCFIHADFPALIVCLIPALIFSCAAQDHNKSGNYESARSCGRAALGCNILALVYFFVAVLAAVILIILYFAVGLFVVNNVCCEYDSYNECIRYCVQD